MLDRKVAPEFHPITHLDFPNPEKQILSNGIPLYILNQGDQEVLRIDWICKSGRIFEPREGVSYFSLKMLGEGAGGLDSTQLQEAFQQYGAFLEFKNGFDYNTITVYTLSRTLDKILDLLRKMAEDPHFDQKDLEVLKNIKIQEIRLNRKKNNIQASQLFRNSLFGSKHPYGTSMNEDDVQSISVENVRKYFHESLLSENQFILSGKVEPGHIDLVKNAFSGLNNQKGPEEPSFAAVKSKNVHRDLPESLQTSLRFGKRSPGMEHPDFIPMMVVNEILGGYFGSRLMKNIREDKGFTYGIHSNLLSLKYEGYFVIGTDVIKENREQTVLEIIKEIKRMQNEPVGMEEMETVKNYMLGNLVSSMDNAFDIADKFKRVHLNGLTMAYYEEMVQTIREIEPLTIQNLASKYLDTDTFVLVTVG